MAFFNEFGYQYFGQLGMDLKEYTAKQRETNAYYSSLVKELGIQLRESLKSIRASYGKTIPRDQTKDYQAKVTAARKENRDKINSLNREKKDKLQTLRMEWIESRKVTPTIPTTPEPTPTPTPTPTPEPSPTPTPVPTPMPAPVPSSGDGAAPTEPTEPISPEDILPTAPPPIQKAGLPGWAIIAALAGGAFLLFGGKGIKGTEKKRRR